MFEVVRYEIREVGETEFGYLELTCYIQFALSIPSCRRCFPCMTPICHPVVQKSRVQTGDIDVTARPKEVVISTHAATATIVIALCAALIAKQQKRGKMV